MRGLLEDNERGGYVKAGLDKSGTHPLNVAKDLISKGFTKQDVLNSSDNLPLNRVALDEVLGYMDKEREKIIKEENKMLNPKIPLNGGMTDEEKEKLVQFTKGSGGGSSLLDAVKDSTKFMGSNLLAGSGRDDKMPKAPRQLAEGTGSSLTGLLSGVKDAITPESSTLRKASKATDKAEKRTDFVSIQPPKGVEVPKLSQAETKNVAKNLAETNAEIKEASNDPSLWEKATSMLGIAGDFASDVFDKLGNPQDRIDWLRMMTIYGLSRAAGNSTNFAMMNGLLRGLESGERKMQAKKMAEQAMAQEARKNMESDREFGLDSYKAESGRITANAAAKNAETRAKEVLQSGDIEKVNSVLTSDERKVAESLAEGNDVDTAVVYEAANQLKKRNLPVTAAALNKVVQQMKEQGKVSDKWFGTDRLL